MLDRVRFSSLALGPEVTLRTAFAPCPAPAPRATILLLHGRSEFIEKYDETLGELAARDLDVFTFDWRGQGLSSRPLPNRHRGHAAGGFAGYLHDLDAVLQRCVQPALRSPHAPLLLLTHSMGGHVALHYQAAHPGRFDGAVHLAPMLEIRLPFLTPALRLALAAAARIGLAERFVAERERTAETMLSFEDNVLTRDRARYERLRETLRRAPRLAVGGPTVGWLDDALRSCAALVRPAMARRILEPTLFVVAGADRVVENLAIRHFAALVPDATLATLDDAEHEILIERDAVRERFWALFDAFLDRRASGGRTLTAARGAD